MDGKHVSNLNELRGTADQMEPASIKISLGPASKSSTRRRGNCGDHIWCYSTSPQHGSMCQTFWYVQPQLGVRLTAINPDAAVRNGQVSRATAKNSLASRAVVINNLAVTHIPFKTSNANSLLTGQHQKIQSTLKHRHAPSIKQLPTNLARFTRKLSSFNPKSRFSTTTASSPLQNRSTHSPISSCIKAEPITHGAQILSDHPNSEVSRFFQKGFSEFSSFNTGRAVQAICLTHSVKLSLFHLNTLMNMYSKFGYIDLARYVFDEMPQKNEASWNTMVSGCVRAELYSEAVDLFREMWVLGIPPSGFALASVVTACSRSAFMVSQGIQIHGFVVKIGLLSDVFVSTSLLHFYGTYGFMSNACKFFEEMPERNIVSWTSLMVGYSSSGDPQEVLKIYMRMRLQGVSSNQNSFATVISSCGLLEDQLLGLQVLAHVVVSGFESNVSVANALISMFGSFGSMEYANYIFNRMVERDTISWNSMISAFSHNQHCKQSLRCFQRMRHGNVKLNSTTLSSLISACSCVDNLKWGLGIHGLVVKVGLDSITCVCNTLLTLYAESGRCEDVELLFQEMPEKDLISWNSMMASYVQNGEYQDALKFLAELHGTREMKNQVIFASALAACSCPEVLIEGKTVHALIFREGLHENLLLNNALVTMYGKCGAMGYAERVFQIMPEHDVVTCNALIGGHMENDEPHKAVGAFKLMRENEIPANYITMVNVIGSFSDSNDLRAYGMPIHAHIVLTGFEPDNYVQNSLLTMYAKCGDLDSSNIIFEHLDIKNVISWNAMVAANAHHGCGEEALKLFVAMHRAGLKFDHFSFSGGLAASSNLALLEEGRQLHNLIIKTGFESDLHVTNAAMDMYGKCGEMEDVLQIVPAPRNRSRLSWNILISGFSRHGYYNKAMETFHHMLEVGPKPDNVTFVSLLSACNHGGLIDDGLAYFDSMTTEFGIQPGIEHCVCIIDLLGRSGRFSDAEKFIKDMVVPPNDLVWRSLLSASRTHNNLDLGRKAAKHLLELDPSDDSAYVLLSNMCATNGRWDAVNEIRSHMKSNKINKKPACSWVKVKNRVSSFGIGDKSHPQAVQIYEKLKDLMKMIKEVGYSPDTSFALHDTDEEQKEHNLWNHSERLALAFGLINTPEGSTVRVFKNLRVCGDCHSVYKLVSEAVERKIVLRDPYRFHHFSGGKCSCGDYW